MKCILIVAVAAIALLAVPAAARAQAKPNFSGSYMFDAAKSDQPASARGRGGRGGGRGGGAAPPMSLTITQTDSQITIDRVLAPNPAAQNAMTSAVYKLDGSESTNALGDVFLSRSKVSWDGSNLVIATTKDLGLLPDGPASENTKEVFSLAGGVLTVTTTTQNTPGTASGQTRKLVYNKKS